MVPYSVPTSQARDRLLEAAVQHALKKGIVDLSLREIALEIGTSHRMLVYHFGSREGLLVAVVREARNSDTYGRRRPLSVRIVVASGHTISRGHKK